MDDVQSELRYEPWGGAREFLHHREPEVLLSGPAGTGKSRVAIEKLHAVLQKYPGSRGLIVRKTLASLTATGLVTYTEQVLHYKDGVRFFSGNRQKPAQYIYPEDKTTRAEYGTKRHPNGIPGTGKQSVLVVGGMDNPMKVMSTEYDIIYAQEATELAENDWEAMTTRLRNGVAPYQQLIADCNPDAPHHWLKQRCDRGQTVMLESRHEDNPRIFHRDGTLTDYGVAYMQKLDNLTGVRLQRLRHGRWVAAEGIVYEDYDRTIHVLRTAPRFHRYICGVDWGYTNPGVISVWGLDYDDRLHLVEEVYMTRRLLDWWIEQAKRIQQIYRPYKYVCDPAEPAHIMSFQTAGIPAVEAFNDIAPGIRAVQERLQVQPDGLPRLSFASDSLKERDNDLADNAKPFCIDQELDSYVWPEGKDGKPLKEVPVDEHNHGLDTLRYVVSFVDKVGERRIKGNRAAVGTPRPNP